MHKRTTIKINVYYTVYQTTNIRNGKIYIGKHITLNPNDEYLGSGVKLLQAIHDCGKENFKKEILALCNSEKEMNEVESLYISSMKANRSSKRYYNINDGGLGGSNHKTEKDIRFCARDIEEGRVDIIGTEYDETLTKNTTKIILNPITDMNSLS